MDCIVYRTMQSVFFFSLLSDNLFNERKVLLDKELEINDKNIEEEFRHHENWKRISGFNATPTLLFNGKKLPEAYNLDDIIYIINNGL